MPRPRSRAPRAGTITLDPERARLARDADDAHDAFVNLRHLGLEQLLDQLRGAPAQDDDGAARLAILTRRGALAAIDGLAAQIGVMESVLAGLGYGGGRIDIVETSDPQTLEARLFELPRGLRKIDPGEE